MLVPTTNGPVLGFADTFGLSDTSTASDVEAGNDGRHAPVLKWLGVPYAQAARWERPSDPNPWTAPLKTVEFGSMFPQPPSGMEGLYGHQPGVLKRSWVSHSEESHTINVFAPEGTKADDNLPVMVWIYGGSLNNGSADRFLYDPTEWVRESAKRGEKFIVVTGNYRTNIFGFFSGPDVVAADKDGLSGNYGLYDCVKMLQWVQSNIASFGGNPGKTTIFGESAGAFLISHLMVSGQRLFQRAILQSGAPSTMTLRPSATSYPAYSTIITQHTAAATPSARISSLRTLPFEQLLQAHNDAYRWGGVGLTLEEGPKAIWSKDTLERLQNGEWDEWIEGVVLGTNEDEGSLFTFGMKLHTEAAFRAYVSSLNPSIQPAVLAKYLPTPHPPPTSSPDYINAPASRVLADQIFVDPAFEHASLLSEVPHHASGKKLSVWKYRCRAQVDRISKGPVKTGVMHAVEIALVFNIKTLWDAGSHEEGSAKALGSRWAAFAIHGNPDPEWKAFKKDEPTWLAFEEGGGVKNEDLKGFAEGRIQWGAR